MKGNPQPTAMWAYDRDIPAYVPVQSAGGGLFVLVIDPSSQAIANIQELNSDAVSDTDNGLVCVAADYGYNGASFDRIRSGSTVADGYAGSALGNKAVLSQLFGWDGASWDRIRVANVFRTVAVTAAGPTAVWTPAAGKKFRLMGYSISVAGTIAASGPQIITLSDAATVIKNHIAELLETVAATTAIQGQNFPCDLGQGELSAAANNVLNVNVGTAMATGNVSVNVWGTEE